MRRWSPLAFLVMASLALTACTAAGGGNRMQFEPSRDTPEGTIQMFKGAALSGEASTEWDILSDALKRRISQRAGREVDVGDYAAFRARMRKNPRVSQAYRLLRGASIGSARYMGGSRAMVPVRVSMGPLIGETIAVGMVRRDIWRLHSSIEPEPFYGYVGDELMGIDKKADGSYEIWVLPKKGAQPSITRVPAEEVERFEVAAQWYIQDLGGYEDRFLGAK